VVVVRSARVGSGIIARNGEQPDDKYDWIVSDDLNPEIGQPSNSETCSETADGVTRESEGRSRVSVPQLHLPEKLVLCTTGSRFTFTA
jgi:hypothetical protein